MIKTANARSSNRYSVRIVWLSSMITTSVPPGGIKFGRTGNPKVLKKSMENYMQSKVGNVFLAAEAAKRLGGDGIISVVRFACCWFFALLGV